MIKLGIHFPSNDKIRNSLFFWKPLFNENFPSYWFRWYSCWLWRYLEEMRLRWLTEPFTKIWRTKEGQINGRKSILESIYKNSVHIDSYSNHRGIKVIFHIMKFYEMVIEHRLRQSVMKSENLFEFMPWRSTILTIHLFCQLIGQYPYWFRKSLWEGSEISIMVDIDKKDSHILT